MYGQLVAAAARPSTSRWTTAVDALCRNTYMRTLHPPNYTSGAAQSTKMRQIGLVWVCGCCWAGAAMHWPNRCDTLPPSTKGVGRMAWFYLLLAGFCEMAWPLGFKYTNGFKTHYAYIALTLAT